MITRDDFLRATDELAKPCDEDEVLAQDGEGISERDQDLLEGGDDEVRLRCLSLPPYFRACEMSPSRSHQILAADGEFEESLDPDLAKGTYDDEEEEEEEDGIPGMIFQDWGIVGRPVTAAAPLNEAEEKEAERQAKGAAQNEVNAGPDVWVAEEEGEILAVDGEPFDSSFGPGTFDEDELALDGEKLDLSNSGNHSSSGACDDGELLIVASCSPTKQPVAA